MTMLVLVNNSHFAFRIVEPVIKAHAKKIKAVVISSRIRGNASSALKVLRKCSRRYAAYRILVDIITRTNGLRGKDGVVALARDQGIPVWTSPNVNQNLGIREISPFEIGVAINFDQLLRREFLDLFSAGVVNLHASRLPHDKGISPFLWSFARGDSTIWATLYRIDEGLDSGPIYEQFNFEVDTDCSAFSLYERICRQGGERLAQIVERYYCGVLADPCPVLSEEVNPPHSWPDDRFDAMLRNSGRRLISCSDVWRSLFSR